MHTAKIIKSLPPQSKEEIQNLEDNNIETTLMNLIINSDYDEAKQLIIENPSIICHPVSCTYLDLNCKPTNFLKFVLDKNILDIFMANIMMKAILHGHFRTQQNMDALAESFIKACKQASQINLEPLFLAYEECAKKYELWSSNPLAANRENLITAIREIGIKQRELLPLYFLKRFLSNDASWNPDSDFKTRRPPVTDSVYVCNSETYYPLSPFPAKADLLPPNSTLIRGLTDPSIIDAQNFDQGELDSIGNACQLDLITLRNLLAGSKHQLQGYELYVCFAMGIKNQDEMQSQHDERLNTENRRIPSC